MSLDEFIHFAPRSLTFHLHSQHARHSFLLSCVVILLLIKQYDLSLKESHSPLLSLSLIKYQKIAVKNRYILFIIHLKWAFEDIITIFYLYIHCVVSLTHIDFKDRLLLQMFVVLISRKNNPSCVQNPIICYRCSYNLL